MTEKPVYKKLFALERTLLFISIPVLLFFETDPQSFFEKFFLFTSEEGIVCSVFGIGLTLVCAACVLRKLTKR